MLLSNFWKSLHRGMMRSSMKCYQKWQSNPLVPVIYYVKQAFHLQFNVPDLNVHSFEVPKTIAAVQFLWSQVEETQYFWPDPSLCEPMLTDPSTFLAFIIHYQGFDIPRLLGIVYLLTSLALLTMFWTFSLLCLLINNSSMVY